MPSRIVGRGREEGFVGNDVDTSPYYGNYGGRDEQRGPDDAALSFVYPPDQIRMDADETNSNHHHQQHLHAPSPAPPPPPPRYSQYVRQASMERGGWLHEGGGGGENGIVGNGGGYGGASARDGHGNGVGMEVGGEGVRRGRGRGLAPAGDEEGKEAEWGASAAAGNGAGKYLAHAAGKSSGRGGGGGGAGGMGAEFGVSAESLAAMMKGRDAEALRLFGGVDGLFVSLQVNPGIGIVTSGGGVSGMISVSGSGSASGGLSAKASAPGAAAASEAAAAGGGEIARRRRAFGDNSFVSPPPKSYLAFVFQALQDMAMVILSICAVVSFVVGFMTEGTDGLYDGIGILVSIVLVVAVSSASDFHQSRQFRALSSEKQKKAVVLRRDGLVRKWLNCDIVVGDVVLLNAGDEVPADGLLISSNPLTMDESAMTGESKAITKNSASPFLISGTKILEGGGVMLVVAVGMNTENGKLMAHASSGCKLNEGSEDTGEEDEETTPLKQRLGGFAVMIGKLGLLVAVLVFVINLTRFLMTVGFSNWGMTETLYILELFSICVTIVVVAVPEGLPLALTLTLAYAMTRMVRDKSFARHLEACETMGLVTVICSDKTGTLTTNSMEVVESCVGFGDRRKRAGFDQQQPDCNKLRGISEASPTGVVDQRHLSRVCSVDRCHAAAVEMKSGIMTPLLEGLVLNNCSSGVVLRGGLRQDDGVSKSEAAGRPANGVIGNHQSNGGNGVVSDNYVNKQLPRLSRDMSLSFTAYDSGLGNVLSMRNPTEWAIYKYGLSLARDQLGDIQHIQRCSQILKVEPFSSTHKRMGVLTTRPNGTLRAHWKGAPEVILTMCDKVADANGVCRPLDGSTKADLKSLVNSMASRSLRTLCLAYCDVADPRGDQLDANQEWGEEDAAPPVFTTNGFTNGHSEHPTPPRTVPTCGLTLIALLGLHDPPREGVKDAVELCKKAGIRLCMLTGDSMATARAIANQCGILDSCPEQGAKGSHSNLCACYDYVIEGSEFHRRTDVATKLQVMARSTPSHKLELVEHLQRMGEVVAVTGDGTNDGPALRAADIGLAMGNGTEVAKESADVIILDDDFRTIVKVVQWGRSVYVNIQKFVQFQLTVNIVALALNFESAVSSGTTPLTAVQLLWVNLIMDTLGALALATEQPTPELMEKRPVERGSSLVNYAMWRNIIGQAVYQLLILLIIQFKGKEILTKLNVIDGPVAKWELETVMFNTFVFCQVFNEINSRQIEKLWVFSGILKNYIFMGIMIVTVFFQYLMVEKLCKFASTIPLSMKEWAFSVVVGSTTLILGVLLKFIPVPSDEVQTHTQVSSPWKAFSWFQKKASSGNDNDIDDAYRPLAHQAV
ncbi:hypothetical protein CBR_g15962 [Chara braunii]|uniref:P-type Ca(2+) transporter n=1 Tax=Chara braunii TaxID=69332 RepID=A0A388JSP3_CHABU|nr:hypothetical protein CBR_g15962 [Chara braunii]|eukprot:GBG60839.1 hypothetical protein CBR_g15962 [Chara braunii]